MQGTTSAYTYPPCCISGTRSYYHEYVKGCDGDTRWLPVCSNKEAECWEDQRKFCCIDGHTELCCREGVTLRALSVFQSVWNSAACLLLCVPACAGSTVISGGAGIVASVLYCSECCYGAEQKTNAKESTRRVAQWAIDCCGNGMLWSAGLCGIGVKAIACCPTNFLCPELGNAWCFEQECNLALSKAIDCDENYKKFCNCDITRDDDRQTRKVTPTAAPPASPVEGSPSAASVPDTNANKERVAL